MTIGEMWELGLKHNFPLLFTKRLRKEFSFQLFCLLVCTKNKFFDKFYMLAIFNGFYLFVNFCWPYVQASFLFKSWHDHLSNKETCQGKIIIFFACTRANKNCQGKTARKKIDDFSVTSFPVKKSWLCRLLNKEKLLVSSQVLTRLSFFPNRKTSTYWSSNSRWWTWKCCPSIRARLLRATTSSKGCRDLPSPHVRTCHAWRHDSWCCEVGEFCWLWKCGNGGVFARWRRELFFYWSEREATGGAYSHWRSDWVGV